MLLGIMRGDFHSGDAAMTAKVVLMLGKESRY